MSKKKVSIGKKVRKSLSKKAIVGLKNKLVGRIKSPPQHKQGKLSGLAKLMLVSVFLIISLPIAQIISEDIFGYDLLKMNEVKRTEDSGKSIYKIDQPELSIDDTSENNGFSGLDIEDFETMGYEAQEAAIIKALEQILGSWSEEKLDEYLGHLKPSYKTTTVYKILPGAIAAHIKFGTSPGIVVSQSIAEQGWYYPDASRRSSSWKYNNPFGIKGGKNSATNEYWTGEIEVSTTHEGWGGGRVKIKDGFRAYKSVWHACMDHSRLLQNDRYAPFNLTSETDPYKYGYNLGLAGYYTDNKVSYANKMKNVYKGINGSKIDELAKLVKEEVQRSGGANMTPNGNEIDENEFQTGGSEGFGPPLENLSNYRVSSWRGPRNTGIKGASRWHQGLDLAAPTGVKILAVKSGVITQSQSRKGYGNLIEIKHDDGMYTRYAHCSKLLVKVGDRVSKGDPVALVGNTGVGSGAHLHFEIRTKNDYNKESSVDHLVYYDKYQSGGVWHIKPKDNGGSGGNTGSSSLNNNGTGTFVTGSLPSGSLSANMPKIKQSLITRNFTAKSSRSVEYIVIHDTGTYQSFADADWIGNLFNTSSRQASSHYGVDEGNIVQYVADKDVSFHAGKNIRGASDPRSKIKNSNSIGIELCVNEGNDWNKTRQNGVALTAQLLIKYGLTPDRVYTHNDVSGKICPSHMLRKYPGQWEDFKKAVEKEYNLLKGVNKKDNTSSNSSSSSSNSPSSNSTSGSTSGNSPSGSTSGSTRDKLTKQERIQIRTEIKKVFDEFGCQTNVNSLSDDRLKLIDEIMKHQTKNNKNKKYLMGGNGPNIFDCSGLQGWVYKHALGITLPRTSAAISTSGMFKQRKGLDDAVAGDIMWNPGHVAMYMGKTSDGKVLVMDAYSTGKPIGFRKRSVSKGKKYLYPSEVSSR